MGVMAARLDPQLLKHLIAPPPNVSIERAETIARESFGVVGRATPLASERDQNFCIESHPNRRYVLKVASPLEPAEVTDLQTRALLHVAARDPQLPTPRVLRTTTGATETSVEAGENRRCTVRLLTFLPGLPLGRRTSTPGLRAELGRQLAKLDKALAGYSHPAAKRSLLWDLTRAAALTELLDCVQHASHRELVGGVIRRFEQNVQSRLTDLRWQLIHNDLNPSNLLVNEQDSERISGIIDFGDMVFSPLVVDVAIAAAYQLRHTPDPIDAAVQFVAAYHRIVPLEDQEIDLLLDLMATRLASAVIITAWHTTIQPQNRDYILRNASTHCAILARLDQLSGESVGDRFRAACGQGCS